MINVAQTFYPTLEECVVRLTALSFYPPKHVLCSGECVGVSLTVGGDSRYKFA